MLYQQYALAPAPSWYDPMWRVEAVTIHQVWTIRIKVSSPHLVLSRHSHNIESGGSEWRCARITSFCRLQTNYCLTFTLGRWECRSSQTCNQCLMMFRSSYISFLISGSDSSIVSNGVLGMARLVLPVSKKQYFIWLFVGSWEWCVVFPNQ